MRSNNRRSLPTVEGGDPEGRQQQLVVDEIMTMLRARSEDGQILISDSGVEFFIQDAIKRILRNQDGSGHPAAPPPVEPVDVAMTGTRTGTREEFVQPAADRLPYTVEVDHDGCAHCNHGRSWTVIGPDGTAEGESWENEEDAYDRAEAMNRAYALARLRAHQEPPADLWAWIREQIMNLQTLPMLGATDATMFAQHQGELAAYKRVESELELRAGAATPPAEKSELHWAALKLVQAYARWDINDNVALDDDVMESVLALERVLRPLELGAFCVRCGKPWTGHHWQPNTYVCIAPALSDGAATSLSRVDRRHGSRRRRSSVSRPR